MKELPSPRRLLSRPEVAEIYGIPRRFLETSAARGDGPGHVHIGRQVFYHPDDIEAWLEQLRRARDETPR